MRTDLHRLLCELPDRCEVNGYVTGMTRARKLRYVTVDILPLRSLVLALFLLLGVGLGYICSGRCAVKTNEELRRYFEAYLAFATDRSLTVETVLQSLACYLRAPVPVFLLGFASIGVAVLPLIFAAQGFVLSFSLFCFASAMGREGFALAAALFAIRLLFVLPCTFLLGTAAMERSCALAALAAGGGKRLRPAADSHSYWYRSAVLCVCLLIGCVLELWLVPLLLTA